jgi:hypothetical protein
MADWQDVLRKPEGLKDEEFEGWFARIADVLLNRTRLVVGGLPHRLTEVEFYYHGPEHPDRFAHRDPVQVFTGRWYFHRTGGVYRSGSFKGVDLTFGTLEAHAGVLCRGLQKPEGTLVDGPSLLVDHLLDATGAAQVPALDRAIAERRAWDPGNPLWLEPAPDLEQKQLFQSARVGLTLKKARPAAPEPPRYLLRPYRFLSEPRRIAKGKLLLVLALHARGAGAEQIVQDTGCPKATVQRYVQDFEAGKLEPDLSSYYGKDLGPKDMCRLHGTWYRLRAEGKLP